MGLALAATVATTTSAHATSIPVSPITSGSPLASGELGYNTSVTGWTNQSGSAYSGVGGYAYNFVYSSASVATGPTGTGATGFYGQVDLDPATIADTGGGAFLALDGDFSQGTVSTTLSGLGVGDTVTVTFDWAGDQQLFSSTGSNGGCDECTGPSTDQLHVTLGGQTDMTSVISVPSQGFSGWNDGVTLTFTATAPMETLSFEDFATPTSPQVPAFALLDDVTVTDTPSPIPEPNSLLLLSTGLLGLGGFLRMRYKNSLASKA